MRLLKPRPAETREEGCGACGISGLPCWKHHQTILLFLSMKDEIDTFPLLECAFHDRKTVFAPKIIDDTLRFFHITSPGGPWETGAFGIREPAVVSTESALPLLPAHFPCLIITPGLAFDRKGNRLGRGKGYYDRFFAELDAQNLPYFSIGLCMPSQIVDHLPAKPWDKKMDAVWGV
jgi:5-formyltetrahydrofolate cyclo-ligase